MDRKSILLLMTCLQISTMVRTQSCLLATGAYRHPPDLRNFGANGPGVLRYNNQVIVPSYKFQCCGSITEWRTQFNGRLEETENQEFNIHLQVWRPSPTVVYDGCYGLAGENSIECRVRNNNFDCDSEDGGATSTSSITINQATTVSITINPMVAQRIAVQPGDVVGVILEGEDEETSNNLAFAVNPSYSNEIVWYGSTSGSPSDEESSEEQCPYPVGINRSLSSFTRFGPVITASVATTNCPTSSIPQSGTPPAPSPSSTTDYDNDVKIHSLESSLSAQALTVSTHQSFESSSLRPRESVTTTTHPYFKSTSSLQPSGESVTVSIHHSLKSISPLQPSELVTTTIHHSPESSNTSSSTQASTKTIGIASGVAVAVVVVIIVAGSSILISLPVCRRVAQKIKQKRCEVGAEGNQLETRVEQRSSPNHYSTQDTIIANEDADSLNTERTVNNDIYGSVGTERTVHNDIYGSVPNSVSGEFDTERRVDIYGEIY